MALGAVDDFFDLLVAAAPVVLDVVGWDGRLALDTNDNDACAAASFDDMSRHSSTCRDTK